MRNERNCTSSTANSATKATLLLALTVIAGAKFRQPPAASLRGWPADLDLGAFGRLGRPRVGDRWTARDMRAVLQMLRETCARALIGPSP